MMRSRLNRVELETRISDEIENSRIVRLNNTRFVSANLNFRLFYIYY